MNRNVALALLTQGAGETAAKIKRLEDGMFHNEKSIISEHYGFTDALLDGENEGISAENAVTYPSQKITFPEDT